MEQFSDTHAHLDFPDFASDLESVLARAREAGIHRIVSIGCDEASSRRAIALAEAHPDVYAAVGWHPNAAFAAPEDVRPVLRELGAHPRVVAIGECGIDHYRLPSKESGGTAEDDAAVMAKQETVFRQQLEVAAELGLNAVIHQRAAHAAAMAVFRPFADRVRGVFHCFVGTVAEMTEVISLGSYVSFTGIVTFKSAVEVRTTLAAVPADRFFLETDCPYLAPVPHRGGRAEPAYVRWIAQKVAEVRGIPLEALARQVRSNEDVFFRWDRGQGVASSSAG